MPSGNVHSATTTSLLVAVTVSHFVIKSPTDLGLVAVGLGVGYALTPDLDVDSGMVFFGKLKRIPILGIVISFIWKTIWLPYALIIPHRSFLSHLPILSTFLRWAYLTAIAFALAFVLRYDQNLLAEIMGFGLRSWFLIFWGNALSDGSHYILDQAEPDRLQ